MERKRTHFRQHTLVYKIRVPDTDHYSILSLPVSPQTTPHQFSMVCQPFTSIPSPPTTYSSCAVPIGGSNSSILDACCNGEINAISTYSSPNTNTNSEDDDGCFQFCITSSPNTVKTCLQDNLEEYESGIAIFECFNTDSARKAGSVGGYRNTGVRKGLSWTIVTVSVLGFAGAMMGFV